jgi:DNA polymerase III delta subunit
MGSEPLGLAFCRDAIKELADGGAFGIEDFTMGEVPAGEIVNNASSSSLFSSNKILPVKVPGDYKFTPEDGQTFLSFSARKGGESTIVVFWEDASPQTKFVAYLRERNLAVNCPVPDKSELPKWLVGVFASKNMTLTGLCAELILERAGDNLNALLGEAEKLSIYPGPGKNISPGEIKELIPLSPSSVIFELGEPVGEKKLSASVPVALDLLETGGAIPVVGSVAAHMKRLHALKLYFLEAERTGVMNPDAATDLDMNAFYVKKLKLQIGRWTPSELKEALNKIELAHKKIVTNPTPPDLVVEELLCDLAIPKSQ